MPRTALPALLGLAALLLLPSCDARSAGGAPPLALERTIPLARVSGRIDHLAVDPSHGRLFVAELGAGTVEAVDLRSGRSLGRIAGLQEPQGLGYLDGADELAVATGGDGMLRFYRASDLTLAASLKLGDDADDIRIDPETGSVLVGFSKALAVVDPVNHKLIRTIPLAAHPEGFEALGGRAYVNLPNAGEIAETDLRTGAETAHWRNPGPHFNFPLALDPSAQLVASVYRLPATVVLLKAASGQVEQKLATCGDADDAFFDAKRGRLYVVCGGGSVDVFEREASGYAAMARTPTRRGARTGLFSPALDRLFVAARAQPGQPAAILVLRPD